MSIAFSSFARAPRHCRPRTAVSAPKRVAALLLLVGAMAAGGLPAEAAAPLPVVRNPSPAP